MLTIAVINQKGGVGKTTSTANLGAGLARQGKRVLLIDFDPQANLTSHLEGEGLQPRGTTIDLLRGELPLGDTALATATPNLFLVPANAELAGAEMELANEIGRETILRDQLERAARTAPYDYVLIDCPPSLGLLAVNALTAADEALVPIQAEFFALQGMARFVEVQNLVQTRLNPRLRLAGIVICMWKGQANLSREVRDEVGRIFGDVLFDTVIRQNVKLAEAPSSGRTIFEYAPESNGALDYESLALEFLRRHDDRAVPPPEPPAGSADSSAPSPAQDGQKPEPPSADQEGMRSEAAEPPGAEPTAPATAPLADPERPVEAGGSAG